MSETSDLIDHESACIRSNAAIAEEQRQTTLSRPSYLLRPRLCIDGNRWCALYGENIQDGVAGFGDSPEAAYADFDRAWKESLPPMPRKKSETSQAEIAKLIDKAKVNIERAIYYLNLCAGELEIHKAIQETIDIAKSSEAKDE